MSESPTPAARAASTIPGNRPPTAVEEAEALAYDAGPEPPMAEDAFMPSCMVWVMFIGLGIMVAAIILWLLTTMAHGG